MKSVFIIIILVAGIALGAFGYKTYIEQTTPKPTTIATIVTQENTPQPTQEASSSPLVQVNGTIEGALGYPAEGIPANMMVCAETLSNQKVKCTDKHIEDIGKYKSGQGYKLDIDPGDYYVYAQTPNNSSYKAYYSDFVPCGLSVNCSSHKPIKVTVKAGETVKGIDPVDWYAPPGSQ